MQADRLASRPMPEAPLAGRVRRLLDAYLGHVHRVALKVDPWRYLSFAKTPALASCDAGRRILALGSSDRACLAVHAYVRRCAQYVPMTEDQALKRVVADMVRSRLDLGSMQAAALVRAAARSRGYASKLTSRMVAEALKRHVKAHGVDVGLRAAVEELRQRVKAGSDGREFRVVVDAVVRPTMRRRPAKPRVLQFTPKRDDWGTAILRRLRRMRVDERARMNRLLALAASGGKKARPSKRWIAHATGELDRSGRAHVGAMLLDLIDTLEPEWGHKFTPSSQHTLRGLIFLLAIAAPEGAAERLEGYARAWRPWDSGYLLLPANAAIHALAMLPGTMGAASLSRLKRRFKRRGEIGTVDKALAGLARSREMSVAELEEIGLPDLGLDGTGRLEISIGPAVAILSITELGALQVRWRARRGRALAAAPDAIKLNHPREVAALETKTQEIEQTLRAQRLRLEGLYLSERILGVALWRERYLNQPLVAGLTQRLIWSVEIDGRWGAGLPQGGGVVDASGKQISLSRSARVKLWHPMQSQPSEVLAWRRRLQTLGLTQPFKQAHREIYVLTQAERRTRVYSNRFAAQIVDQHRFRALCQARGWNCPMFGGWDSGSNGPSKQLADRELRIEFHVGPVEQSADERSTFRHLSTDQVRFTTPGGKPVPLASVDPVVFSEVMRDADLFVSVAGIAADPTWSDRRDFDGYWGRAAFGALTESGKTRHAVLKDLLPGLRIAAHCRLEEKYLIVKGKLRTYRIHLGSANIQMEPDSQYLCIVADPLKAARTQVRLPFEGDSTLAIILSKAFMLVDDDAIGDDSIRSQILGRGRGR